MTRPVDPSGTEAREASVLSTVLDRVRPTVVVRRRVYQVPASAVPTGQPVTGNGAPNSRDDEDNGPPSSVNVARALRSLRADELRRVEQIVNADDVTPSPVPPIPSPLPALRVGRTITLVELAVAMAVPKQELITALVTRGFFSVTVKTALTRDMARLAAAIFEWRVEDDDSIAVTPRSARSGTKVEGANNSLPNKLTTRQSPSKKPRMKKPPRKTSRSR